MLKLVNRLKHIFGMYFCIALWYGFKICDEKYKPDRKIKLLRHFVLQTTFLLNTVNEKVLVTQVKTGSRCICFVFLMEIFSNDIIYLSLVLVLESF